MIRFNGLFLGRREDSPVDFEGFKSRALEWANQVSDDDPELNWFVYRFDTQTKALGITFSEALRAELGFVENHYEMTGNEAESERDAFTADEIEAIRVLLNAAPESEPVPDAESRAAPEQVELTEPVAAPALNDFTTGAFAVHEV